MGKPSAATWRRSWWRRPLTGSRSTVVSAPSCAQGRTRWGRMGNVEGVENGRREKCGIASGGDSGGWEERRVG
eukprot:3381273-Pleurochrysis_carterae.AAC.5